LLHNLTFMFPFQDQNYAWPGCFMLSLQGHNCAQPNVAIARTQLRSAKLLCCHSKTRIAHELAVLRCHYQVTVAHGLSVLSRISPFILSDCLNLAGRGFLFIVTYGGWMNRG
jgi:hypothetical protein